MTVSGTSLDRELQAFAVELFERSGGAADWPVPEAPGEVVVPPELAAAAGLPGEEFRLSTAPESGALHVSLAGDFLDVAARTLDVAVPRCGSFCIAERYLTTRELSDKIAHTFTWQNARGICGPAEPTSAAYHWWTLHGSLQSEDVWESLFQFAINAQSKAPLDLPDAFQEPDLRGCEPGEKRGESSTYAAAIAEGKRRMKAASAEFIHRLDQRLERDRKRVRDYYRALAREADGSKRRAAAPPSSDEIAAKKRAVDLELRRKLVELNEHYALCAVLRPVVVATVRLPALVVPVLIQRRRASCKYHLYWNSLLKNFEPLACTRCHRATFSATFTNETVELQCDSCAARSQT